MSNARNLADLLAPGETTLQTVAIETDRIILNGTDGSASNAGDDLLLDASAASTDVGERFTYEDATDDASSLTSQFLPSSLGSEDFFRKGNTTNSAGRREIAFGATTAKEGGDLVDFAIRTSGINGTGTAMTVDASGFGMTFGTDDNNGRPFRFFGDRILNTYCVEIVHDGDNAGAYGMKIQCGADNNAGTNYGLTFSDGDGTTMGHITFSGGTVSYGAFTAHHPCIIPNSDNNPNSEDNAYDYGTLLETTSISYTQKNGADSERGIVYNVQKTQSANSKSVLGAYGSSMNGGPDGGTNLHQALILGDGHILCNNAGGNIAVGDGICSSATEGIGQKATANPSMIIGIAQEAVTFSNGTETKLVAVQYGLQQFIPWS